MFEITKCLNEWNATVEALGQGKQTILIRKYNTNLKEFLLYPTTSYALKDNYLDSFTNKDFAKNNVLPKKENNKTEVKYYAKVEKVIEKPSTSINAFNDFHIWTRNHVKSYLGKGKAYIWVLRVYKLENPQLLKRTNGMLYANVEKEVSLNNITPVLSDDEFNRLVKAVENK
jgi:hypothetical protein